MKRDVINVTPIIVNPLKEKAAACTASNAQQLVPAISAGLIAVYIFF